MKETINSIRAALDELEQNQSTYEVERVLREVSAVELPQITTDVVDFLMPRLSTYEAAFYWYMFRHSILESGDQYVRTSVRRFQTDVVRSVRGRRHKGRQISEEQVRGSSRSLESIGAIRKEGEPGREGTLYKVLTPEEIEACREAMKARQTEEAQPVDVQTEVDHYNVRENRHEIFERDGYACVYCGKQLTRFTATLDHVTPVSVGGDNNYDNLVTACLSCNSKKSGKPLGDFLADHDPPP